MVRKLSFVKHTFPEDAFQKIILKLNYIFLISGKNNGPIQNK